MGMNMRGRGGRGGDGTLASYLEEQKLRGNKTDARTLRRVMQAFKPYKFQVVLVLIAILATTLLGLINPLLIARIFDDAIDKRNLPLLIIYVGIMIVTPVIASLIGVFQTYINNLVGQNVMRDFRNRLYEHLQSLSLRFFTDTRTGEIQSRLSNDVNGVQGVVTSTATSIVSNISTVVSTIIAMIWLSPLLTILALCLLPLFLWITAKVGDMRRMTSKETQQSMASLTAMMQETLSVSGILLMKTFGRQQYAQDMFVKENQNLTTLEIRQQLIGRWFFMFINVFFSISPALVYLIAGWQIITHGVGTFNFGPLSFLAKPMSFGTIVAFTTLQSRIYFPIGQLLTIQVDIQGALALFDRIFEYLDITIDIKDAPDAVHLDPHTAQGHIAFKDVTFSYAHELPAVLTTLTSATTKDKKTPDEEVRQTLKNVSFEVKPGQLAALVGPSGAGKTTMTYLVPRLYDVDSGSVNIDGHNVKDVQLSSLGELVGMVTQETYLFHASVRENLLYARLDATDEEMIAAAKAAAIHERIMDLDNGYDTIVGERGYKLSGGEKQRIAIARVILKNPRVLVLDEATSALDTHSERLIQAALVPLMQGRTTLAIAHRLSTILAADVILVVDKGEIVERGTHQELLTLDGLYAHLYNEQFQKLPLAAIEAAVVEEQSLT
ncbi:multidrug ABC transporter ATP-binding protein [Ktedonobacteria bacterium brp13]|nr:multidrug ABC transporter ATP-binding protein [Ktedonobacteria bacterium brp13]